MVTEPVTIALLASDADNNSLTLRVVSQPEHGAAGLSGRNARYFPDGVFSGDETFTVAAWDRAIDSNLATITVHVGGMLCAPGCEFPDGACDPLCGSQVSRDAMVAAPKSMHVRIGSGSAGLAKTVSITVQDIDAAGSDGGAVRLEVLDGDCPAGTVASTPAFPGGSDELVLLPGQAGTASVGLQLAASGFATPWPRAPERCHLLVHAIVVDATDPAPSNNDSQLELSIIDLNDRVAAPEADVVLASIEPAAFDIVAGTSSVTR